MCRKKWVGEYVNDVKMELMMPRMINETYEKYLCKCNLEFTTLTTILMCKGQEQKKVNWKRIEKRITTGK